MPDDLITRIREAKEGSRELDAAIGRALSGTDARKDHWYDLHGILTTDEKIRPFTSSLDAATALCERVLPGWNASIHTLGSVVQLQAADEYGELYGPEVEAIGRTPALALVLAILIAKDSGK